jgi:hypothetical protein
MGLLTLIGASWILGGCDFTGKYKGEVEGEFRIPKPSPEPLEETPIAQPDIGNDREREIGTGKDSGKEPSPEEPKGGGI